MLKNHPRGLITLFFTEMWERFGFYTMLAVFTLYMDEVFGWDDSYKGNVYGAFLAFVYFTPIIGGWIADRFLGYRITIMLGAVILGIGYALLALSGADRLWLFYVSLAVMVVGNGLFKANISVLVGNLYEPGSPFKDVGYNIFYMGINVGAFLAPLAATFMHNAFGSYNAAFAIAAVGMVVSLVIFEIWKKKYIHADNKNAAGQQNQAAQEAIKLSPEQEKERLLALCTVFLIVIFFWMSFHQNGFALTLFAQRSTIDENKITGGNIKDWSEFKKEVMSDSLPLTEEFAAMAPAEQLSERELNSLNKVLFVPDLFFINQQRQVKLPYEDKPNTEILRKMSILGLFSMTIQDQEKIGLKKAVHEVDALISVDRDSLSKADLRTFRIVNRKLLAQRYSQIDEGYYPLKPETYATFNPFFILLLTPLVVGLFNWLRKRSKEPSSPAKMGIGMFLSGIAMMIMAIACLSGGNADANNLSPSWLISSYFVITIGELFLSPMGLSFVSKVAPARMRGLMMGGWFGATAVGNYLSGFIGQFYSTLEHHEFFIILVVLLFLSALMIRLTLKKLKHATRGT